MNCPKTGERMEIDDKTYCDDLGGAFELNKGKGCKFKDKCEVYLKLH